MLAEESRHGRYVRDDDGKLIPETIWKQLQTLRAQEAQTKRRQDKHPERAPLPKQTKLYNTGPLRGRKDTLKEGGHLSPLTTSGTVGGVRKPKKRSHLAQLDAEIRRSKKDHRRLAKKLERMRAALEAEEAAIYAIEDECRAAHTKVPNDLSLRKIRFEEKSAEFERQERELQRRRAETANQEMKRKVMKEKRRLDQERARRAVIENKRLESLDEDADLINEVVELPDDEKAAIAIQRTIRGKIAKLGVSRRRKAYNDAASKLSRVWRGKKARKRTNRIRREEAAARRLQRRARGMQGRKRAAGMRQENLTHASAQKVQGAFRARKGRERAYIRREFVDAKKAALRASQQIYPSFLQEILEIEAPAPLALFRVLSCVMTLAGSKIDEAGVTWQTLLNFVDSVQFLPMVRKMAHDAYREELALPLERISSVSVYFHDPAFTIQEVSKIRPGGRAGALLLEWVVSLMRVNELLSHFTEGAEVQPGVYWDDEAALLELEKKALDAIPKTYIVDGVLPEQPKRPRQVMVCVARDVPYARKERLVLQLMQLLPEIFVRINKPKVDLKAIQATFDTGKSVIVDVDVGIGAANRNAFLQQLATVRRTLSPTPMICVLHGDNLNRHGGGASPALGVHRKDAELMSDWSLKQQMEEAAEQLNLMNQEEAKQNLSDLGANVVNAPPELVLLFEAVMILMTPKHRFRSPTGASPLVTWPAARKMLEDIPSLIRRLSMVDIHAIPNENLRVLQAYQRHPKWPSRTSIPGGDASAACRLMQWVNAVVSYGVELDLQGGKPIPITKKDGVFASVVKIADTVHVEQQFAQILTPCLRDMKIYAQAHKIQMQHLVVSVFRDCEKFFFIAYDPRAGLQYYTIMPDAYADQLLAPNSIEASGDPRPPPETLSELCVRLVELLVLEKIGHHKHKQLKLRRKTIRLLRASQMIGSNLSIITASEEMKGEIAVRIYVPATSTKYDMTISQAKIQACIKDSAGKEKEELMSEDPKRMAKPLVDRLEFRRNKLKLRTVGGDGRKIFERGMRMNGVRVVTTVFYLLAGIRVKVYLPNRSESFGFRLSFREMKDLLGEIAVSARKIWLQKLIQRLSVQDKIKVVLDRRLWKETLKIGSIYCTLNLSTLGEDGGLKIMIYNTHTSEVFELCPSDAQIADIIQTEDDKRKGVTPWPIVKSEAEDKEGWDSIFRRICRALAWDRGVSPGDEGNKDALMLAEGRIMGFGSPPIMITMPIQDEDRVVGAETKTDDGDATLVPDEDVEDLSEDEEDSDDEEESDAVAEDDADDGEAALETQKLRRGRMLCSFAFKQPDLDTLITASAYDDDDNNGELRLVAHDPAQSTGAGCTLTPYEVQQVVAHKVELLAPDRRSQMAEYILHDRMKLLPAKSKEAKRAIRVGKHVTDGVFVIRVKAALLYSQTKATPFPKEGDADMAAQKSAKVVIKGGVEQRGKKVFTSGLTIGDTKVMVTTFAVLEPPLGPALRYVAYLPEQSKKFTILHKSPDVQGNDAELKALAEKVSRKLALVRNDEGTVQGLRWADSETAATSLLVGVDDVQDDEPEYKELLKEALHISGQVLTVTIKGLEEEKPDQVDKVITHLKIKADDPYTGAVAVLSLTDDQVHPHTQGQTNRASLIKLCGMLKAQQTDQNLTLTFVDKMLLAKTVFILRKRPCLVRIHEAEEVIYVEILDPMSNTSIALIGSESGLLDTLDLQAKQQFATAVIKTIAEHVPLGRLALTLGSEVSEELQTQFDALLRDRAAPFKHEVEKKVLKAAFDRVDTDGSGQISVDEMKIFLDELGWDLDAHDAFNYLDKDTSASLSFAEFLRWKAYAWDRHIAGQEYSSPTTFQSDLNQITEDGSEDEWSGDEAEETKVQDTGTKSGEIAGEAARAYLDNLYDRAENEPEEDPQSNEGEVLPSAYGTIPVDADPELNEMDSDMFASLYLEELMTMFTDDSGVPSGNEVPAP